MRSNVMTKDKDIITTNDGLYGTNRITYSPLALGLAGNEVIHDAGSLKEQQHVSVNYDVAQKFPAQSLAEALKPTQTDIKQVHGISSEFKYIQFAKGVEFQMSNMQNVNASNIEAGITRELWKEWDSMACAGQAGNQGFFNHPRADISTAAGALTFALLVTTAQVSMANLKGVADITSEDISRVTFLHDSEITAVLDVYEAGAQLTNREKFMKQFPGMVLVEAPSNIIPAGGPGQYLMILRELVTLHRASLPAMFAREPGKYGLSQDSLFTYESTGVEVEVPGAIQQVTFA